MIAAIIDTVKPWTAWMAPAIVVGLCSIAFSVGVYIGENRTLIEVIQIQEKLNGHIMMPRHAGSIGAETLAIEFREINRRLERLEDMVAGLDRQ